MSHAVRPGRRCDDGERQRDLHVVVIDPSQFEMLEGRQRSGGDHQGEDGGISPGDAPRQRGDARHRGKEPQQRPDRAHQPFGKIGVGENPRGQKQSGKSRIDQARPVGDISGRRIEPRFKQVEPPVSGEEFPHLHQPHGVVGIEQAGAQLAPALGKQKCAGQRPREAEQDAKMNRAIRNGHRC